MLKRIRVLLAEPENAFLLYATIFGLLFVAIVPMMKAHDEWNHFYRAHDVSEGHAFPTRHKKTNIPGAKVPLKVIVTVDSFVYDIPYSGENIGRILFPGESEEEQFNPFTPEERRRRKEVLISSFRVSGEEISRRYPQYPEKAFAYFPNTALYMPLNYLPQATGIALGKGLSDLPVVWMFMGRVFNLFSWIALVYVSIRLTPIYKRVFLLLALNPMALFLAASLSSDSLTMGLSFLTITLFLKYSLDDKIRVNARRFFLICVLSVLMSVTKAYFLIPLLFFLIPRERVAVGSRYIIAPAVLLSSIALVLLFWGKLMSGLFVPILDNTDPFAQMGYILKNPHQFVLVLIKSLWVYKINFIRWFYGNLGHYGGLLSPAWIPVAHTVLLLAASLAEKREGAAFGQRDRALLLVVFALSVVNILTLSYLWASPVGSDLSWPQGRYFIPVSPLILLPLYGLSVREYFRRILESRWFVPFIHAYLALSLAHTLYVIYSAYYL